MPQGTPTTQNSMEFFSQNHQGLGTRDSGRHNYGTSFLSQIVARRSRVLHLTDLTKKFPIRDRFLFLGTIERSHNQTPCTFSNPPGVLKVESQTHTAIFDSAVVEPKYRTSEPETRRQPRYHVVLWDDEEHTYTYVIDMLKHLFAIPKENGFKVAEQVDHHGRASCLTTTLEHAELKRDQIRAFGNDPRNPQSRGSMAASIEVADE